MQLAHISRLGKHGAVAALAGLALLTAPSAQAYVGPGAGLSAIGVLVALLGAVALAVVGFVWYPLKRLFGKAAPAKTADEGNDSRAQR
jgi:hypothetical protein